MSKESELTKLPHEILKEAQQSGIEADEKARSATFFHLNQQTVQAKINEYFEGKIELLDTKTALKRYPDLEQHMWRLVARDKDEYTRKVAENFSGGYFIRILPNAEITFPLQSCLMIRREISSSECTI
ncbi:MAG: hypothetical protein ACPLIG_02185 [Candidatus Bathyarchaeales archaeon]